VNYGEEEEIVLPQIFLNAANDQGTVGVTNLFGDDADSVGAPKAKGASEIVGAVIEILGRRNDALLGVLWNGTGGGGVVESGGNGAGRQTEVLGDGLKGDLGLPLWADILLGQRRHPKTSKMCTRIASRL
jgi:hypothetical protein